MRLRITITFVSLLAVALLLAGGASLLLVRHAQSEDIQRTVLAETKALAKAVNSPSIGVTIAQNAVFQVIKSVSNLNAEGIVTVASNGHVVSSTSTRRARLRAERHGTCGP